MESQCEFSFHIPQPNRTGNLPVDRSGFLTCFFPFFLHNRDIWAIGVITYFLLCGYTPFDRDSNLEEMQAILAGDYSFTPAEYWRGISDTARDFIKRCLITDPKARMTAHEGLQHAWINPPYNPDVPQGRVAAGENLLPTVKKNFNARRTLHRAIDAVRAINKLREGGHLMMDGVMSVDPNPARINHGGPSQRFPQPQKQEQQQLQQPEKSTRNDDAMEIDSYGDARGQTPQQIKAQEQKLQNVVSGLWNKSAIQKH